MGADWFINMGVTALFLSIKSEEGKVKLKKICLKVYTTIKTVYAGDADFA